VLVTHGTDDPRLGVDHARAAREQLAPFPLAVEYHEVKARHAITAEVRGLLTTWAARVAGVADRPADAESADRAHRVRAAPPSA
jgi:predicted esterase